MSFFNKKRILILGFTLVLLAAIPLTVYLAQKQQETRGRAEKSTKLSFTPLSTQASPLQKKVDEAFSLDITMDPGKNRVVYLKLDISYDDDKLATSSAGTTCADSFCPNPSALSILNLTYAPGSILVTLSAGLDPSKFIQTQTKIATITFKPIAETTPGSPSQILFGNQTIVRSSASTDLTSENVLSTTEPAFIAIAAGLSPSPTGEISPTLSPSPTPPGATTTPNQPPVCTALGIDRESTGTAPLSIAFTATGNDPDTNGKINKATFNFGDGPVQDVTEAGGIGTNSVSVQVSHTYQNAGTFQASAILTDNNGAISDQSTCTQTIVVSRGVGGEEPTASEAQVTEVPVSEDDLAPTIAQPGPDNKIIGIGGIGLLLSIIGGILLFAL